MFQFLCTVATFIPKIELIFIILAILTDLRHFDQHFIVIVEKQLIFKYHYDLTLMHLRMS